MWELNHKEGWAPKNWCFWTVVLEKTLESPLDCKQFQPVNRKGNQSWIFIGRTDAGAETPILWPADVKADSLEKTLMLGRKEGRRRKVWQRMRWLDGITNSMDMSLSKLWGLVKGRKSGMLQSMGLQRVRATEKQHAACMLSHFTSVLSDSLWAYGLESARLLSPLDSPGKSIGVGCNALL